MRLFAFQMHITFWISSWLKKVISRAVSLALVRRALVFNVNVLKTMNIIKLWIRFKKLFMHELLILRMGESGRRGGAA